MQGVRPEALGTGTMAARELGPRNSLGTWLRCGGRVVGVLLAVTITTSSETQGGPWPPVAQTEGGRGLRTLSLPWLHQLQPTWKVLTTGRSYSLASFAPQMSSLRS